MKILAIETSCDDTGVALIDTKEIKRGTRITIEGNALLSQTPIHALLGGVVPSLAKCEHQNNLIPMLTLALKEARALKPVLNPKKFSKKELKKLKEIFSREEDLYDIFTDFIPTIKKPKFDIIAVTSGPGLEPALWVGINFAKALGLVWNKQILPINHMEGHILSSLLVKEGDNFTLEKPTFPLLSLLISGGHTELVLAKRFGSYSIIGETRDDAVGEAFDKVARMLGLPYPGGPHISKLAEEARSKNIISKYELPRPMIHSNDLDFSFSGLKTSVLYTLKKISGEKPYDISYETKLMVAREFEDAVTEVLVEKVKQALQKTNAKTLAVGGGVIANKNIRQALAHLTQTRFEDVALYLPTPNLTTDNAVMIGLAGYFKTQKTIRGSKKIVANGNLRLK